MSGEFNSANSSGNQFASKELKFSDPSISISRSASGLWQAGRYDELSSQLTGDMDRAETSEERQEWIDAANDLACVRRAAGDHETAAYFQLLVAAAERRPGSDGPGRVSPACLGNLACDMLLAGRLGIAESLLWKSLLTELGAGNDAGAAADWANLGLLAGMLGQFDEAKERLWEALKRHRRLRDEFHMGLDLEHLAQIFELEGDWTCAAKLFRRAATLFARVGNSAKACAARRHTELNTARAAVLAFDATVN